MTIELESDTERNNSIINQVINSNKVKIYIRI